MHIDDLWIGDVIHLKSRGIQGVFRGKGANNLIKIEISKTEWIEVPEDEISITNLDKPSGKTMLGSESNKKATDKKIIHLNSKEVIEKYQDHSDRLIDYQLIICEEFIQSIVKQKATYCKIIHGEDDLSLKSAVAALLRKQTEVSIYTPHPDRDAWEVWFDYGDGEEEQN